MAVTDLVRGSARLVLARWALMLLAAVPGIVATSGALDGSAARAPFVTAARRPLPLTQYLDVWDGASGGLGVLAGGAVLSWLLVLFLTAGAVHVLDPAGRPWRTIRSTVAARGGAMLLPYLRVAACAALAHGAGLWVLALVFRGLSDHATVAGWTAKSQLHTLGAARLALSLVWLSLVGVAAFWSRIVLAAEERRYVRRLPAILWGLFRRHPARALLAHVLASLVVVTAPLPLLAAWHQSRSGAVAWLATWLIVVAATALVWHGRLRAGLELWRSPSCAELRRRPDEPWGVLRSRVRDARADGNR